MVNKDLKVEMLKNQELFSGTLNLQPSDTGLFINGLFHDMDVVDIFGILDVLKQELKTMEGLNRIGLKGKRLSSVMTLDFNADPYSSNSNFAVDIRDSAITWANDLEKDDFYQRWSPKLTEMLRPTFPGMIRQIRRNFFSLVVVVNPADQKNKGLYSLLTNFVQANAPIRCGIVLSVNADPKVSAEDDVSVAMLQAFNYIAETNPRHKMNFLNSVS